MNDRTFFIISFILYFVLDRIITKRKEKKKKKKRMKDPMKKAKSQEAINRARKWANDRKKKKQEMNRGPPDTPIMSDDGEEVYTLTETECKLKLIGEMLEKKKRQIQEHKEEIARLVEQEKQMLKEAINNIELMEKELDVFEIPE